MTGDQAGIDRAITRAYREDYALVLAATIRVARDIDLAEECTQEAFATAVRAWRSHGVPRNPGAWLTTIARRRAADAARRTQTLRSKLPLLIEPDTVELAEESEESQPIAQEYAVPDERLRLIFMCCHPALSPEAQIGLTLRLVCGLSTPDVARALLVSEPTMAARITRAKKKIVAARIPFRAPPAAELPVRLHSVLAVIHQVYTAGHTAPSGSSLMRPDLVDQALHLARTVRLLMPDEPEVIGLLALLMLTDARRVTRTDVDGRLVRLEDQDRSAWDHQAIVEAHGLIADAIERRPGRYVLQAAIAAVHAEAPTFEATDWRRIVDLYDRLLVEWPSPVVALNRAVAISMVSGPAGALKEVEALEGDEPLAAYPYLPAIKADLLRRLGRADEAAAAYRAALELTVNAAERAFLTDRLLELTAS